jgi:hypothetical protein
LNDYLLDPKTSGSAKLVNTLLDSRQRLTDMKFDEGEAENGVNGVNGVDTASLTNGHARGVAMKGVNGINGINGINGYASKDSLVRDLENVNLEPSEQTIVRRLDEYDVDFSDTRNFCVLRWQDIVKTTTEKLTADGKPALSQRYEVPANRVQTY